MSIKKRKFLFSGQYRRECLTNGLRCGFGKIPVENGKKKRTTDLKMMDGGYVERIKNFPAAPETLVEIKDVIDGIELKFRGGDAVTSGLTNGLKLWDTGKTGAQTVNVLGETALGTHALGEAVTKWRKGHYFCCVCSGVMCLCFDVGATAILIPGGYGV